MWHVSFQAPELQLSAMKFLLQHSNACDCGVCFSTETKFQMFCTAVVYARFAYVNEEEFDSYTLRSIFKQLLMFWEEHRKDKSKFPRTDTFYVISARMLLYTGHYFWKFEKDWAMAVAHLKRGLKGLDKVKYGACLTKRDLELQITNMEETIKEMQTPRTKQFLRTKCDAETTSKDAQMKRPTVTVAQKLVRPQPSLLEMINGTQASSINFQIHDDSDEASSMVTPNVKKSSQNRLKKTKDAPMRTPSHRMKPTEIEPKSKTVDRPKRTTRLQNLTPTIPTDLSGENKTNNETKSTPETGNGNETDVFAKTTTKRNTRRAAPQSK